MKEETKKLTDESILQKLQKDEKFAKEFIQAISIHIKETIEEDKRYAYYIIFTPLWKQLWHKIIGIKPYKQLSYKPTF